MAQEDTPTTEADRTETSPVATTDDPVGLIEDNIVRRLVRVAVHVRGYAPYYAATVAFGVMLMVVPALGGGDDGGDAVASGATRGTTAAPTAPSTTAAPRSTSPAPVELASTADDFFTPPVRTEATRSNSSSYSFDDFDYDRGGDSEAPTASETDDTEKPCYVEPPDGAPVSPVSPEREAENGQNTLESAVGQEAPAESSDAVKSAVDASGSCEDEAGTEALPDPTDPVAPTTAEAPAVDDDVIVDLAGNMFLF